MCVCMCPHVCAHLCAVCMREICVRMGELELGRWVKIKWTPYLR